jgi:HAE1 family hydrophobic/amphiphilic exporter-1
VQTEVASRESELIVASQNVSIAENNLKRLILADSRAKEWPMAIVPTDEPSFDEAPINLDDALVSARANRPEFQRLRIQREINGIDLRYFKNQTRPRIDLIATVSTTGLAGVPVISTGSISGSAVPAHLDGGFGQTLKNLASLQTRNIVVGVVIEIPFSNRRAKADLAGARVAESQIGVATRMQEQTVEVEVRNAAQGVESARQRVISARNTRENAELQQRGEHGLYEVGRSTTFLLFQRENQLTSARSLELRALTDYNKALADLQRATSTVLRANNVVLANTGGR